MTPARVALRRGLAAFGVVALAGQLIPTVIDLFGGGLAFSTARTLGWFYTLAFHKVAFVVDTGRSDSTLSIAFLTGTALVVWLLYRGGRAAARVAGPSPGERALAGALVAPAYAMPIGLVTLATHLELRFGAGGVLPAAVQIHGVVWEAFVFPFVIAAVAGAAGGLLTAEIPDRIRAWLVGGWRMLLTALGLALIGLLLLAALRPEGLRTYVHAIAANGDRVAALLLGHQVLLLPNQSFFVLAPSMGSCVSLRGPVSTVPVLCPGRLPALGDQVTAATDAASNGGPAPAGRPMPAPYWLFLLVPGVATVVGGRWAAGSASGAERWIRGAGAGVAFGMLVAIGTWASTIGFRWATVGPSPVATSMLALAWGVIGGAVGALVPVGQAGPGGPVPEPPPPSPTSV